jgi:3-dehydroquinate synthase
VLDALVADLAADPPARRLVVLTDDVVAPLYADRFVRRVRRRGLSACLIVFPHGESHKNRRTKGWLEDRMLELNVGRDAAVVALGGGVTGDLAGFVAATWHRGIPVVQVPTSLLAMADAALGGKTAVDLPGGKNLVGAFHQPWGLYADTRVLETLDERTYRDGFAEVVKAGAIGDLRFFRWLESHAEALLERDPVRLEQAIGACLRIKGGVVVRDETEHGLRALLNFGHTIGHALEAVSRYRTTHGRAVSIGMIVESVLAVRRVGFPEPHAERLRALIETFGLPVRYRGRMAPEAIVRATRRDKKVRDGRVRYALPRRLGSALPGSDVTIEIDDAEVRSALAAVN